MLVHAHQYLKPQGLLYLVLPLPCLTNSRYTTHERLESILRSCGWSKVKQHDSAKLTYWLCARVEADGKTWKRDQLRTGAQRNNFCVIVEEECAKRAVELSIGPSSPSAVRTEAGDEIKEDVAEGEEEEWGGIAEA